MLCHHYKTLFVHVPKTAGQSVENVFLNLLGLTWETRAPLLLRKNTVPELGPPRLAHLKASEYVQFRYMTDEQFGEYFKFAFVRNPWDRAVSNYKYLNHSGDISFKQYLFEHLSKSEWQTMYWFVGPQYEYLYDENGRLLVDFVGKFESLQDDFYTVCQRIGLGPTELPFVNKSEKREEPVLTALERVKKLFGSLPDTNRKQHKRFQDYYDDESREFVAELYRKDIELFGYEFEPELREKP